MPRLESAPRMPFATSTLLLLVTVLFACLRLRLLDIPLERDEGDYAYHAQLLLQGIAPYTQAYEMRPPGLFAAYAAILAVFGETREGLRLGLLLISAATLWIVGRLAGRWFAGPAAVTAGIVYGTIALSSSTGGFTANTEHFVLLFALAGLARLVDATGARVFTSGCLLGLAVLMKQHAIVYLLPACVILWQRGPSGRRSEFMWRDGSRLLLGIALPVGLALGAVAASGAFERFWFWTVIVPANYVSSATLESAWAGFLNSAPSLVAPLAGCWLLALLGLGRLVRQPHPARPFLFTLAIASLAAICVGFTFRSHGWLFAAPAAALFAAAGVDGVATALVRSRRPRFARGLVLALCTLPLGQWLWSERAYLFTMSADEISRAQYPGNPFVESVEIGRVLRERTQPGDTIAIFGSEPQILFYAGRRSASPYILAYPLMEIHPYALEMQQEMMAAVEAAEPRFVVHVNVPTSWLQRPDSELALAHWMTLYTVAHYRQVGLAEIGGETSRVRWDEPTHRPSSPYWLSIYERRAAP